MKLKELLHHCRYPKSLPESILSMVISGLSSDHRFAKQGDLFIAKKGIKSHGLDYLEDLRAIGVAVIAYEKGFTGAIPTDIPTFEIDDAGYWATKFAPFFYKSVIEPLSIIGITGTEGKTSVSQFTAKALKLLNQPCGLIGTNGIGFIDDLKDNTHTTPDLLALYSALADLSSCLTANNMGTISNKINPIALEVTSHALDQKRISGLTFKVTTLTNLARDHLDYHGTIENYAKAKKRLFLDYPSENSVLNIDDDLGRVLFDLLQKESLRTLYPYGVSECTHPNYLWIKDLTLLPEGLTFALCYQGQEYALKSPLYGHFNAYNLTATIGNALALGYSIGEIIEIIPSITTVDGRMESIAINTGAIGIIDYAHKPNALLQVLKALHKHIEKGEIYCVFGCGGDRDRGKRALMAEIAEKNADHIIITNDNPRSENPSEIAKEIQAGLSAPNLSNVQVILDRAEAIHYALSKAKKGDIVLIAGKGHETYQIIGNQTLHFSDSEIIHEFNKKNKL